MKINIINTEKIQTEIDNAQTPRQSVRLIDVDDITNAVNRLETYLSGILFKKDWQGLEFDIDVHATSFPGSYRGIPYSTHFVVYRGANDWFVTGIARLETAGPRHKVCITGMDAKAAALAEFAKFHASNVI